MHRIVVWQRQRCVAILILDPSIVCAGEPSQRGGLFPESEEDGELGLGNDYDIEHESPRYRGIRDRPNDDSRRGADSAAESSDRKDTMRSSPNIRLDRSREVNRYMEGSLHGGNCSIVRLMIPLRLESGL